jgi:hypothetical protein
VFFELLHSRLVDYLRSRVKSGELTERRLARLAGLSQPHLHNVLKGVRLLSAGMADTVVMNLQLSALDLVCEEELTRPGGSEALPRYRQIPLAAGWLGPGYPFPDLQESAGRLPFSTAELDGVAHPVAVRLAPDPDGPSIFRAGDVVLLDLLPPGGQPLQPGNYYAIDAGRCGLMRCLGSTEVDSNEGPDPAPGSPDGVVRARAVWFGRFL